MKLTEQELQKVKAKLADLKLTVKEFKEDHIVIRQNNWAELEVANEFVLNAPDKTLSDIKLALFGALIQSMVNETNYELEDFQDIIHRVFKEKRQAKNKEERKNQLKATNK